MDVLDLVELASLVTTHGPTLVVGATRLSEAGIGSYWSHSKCRLERWNQVFRDDRAAEPQHRGKWTMSRWRTLRPTLEELLGSELLTRTWTAIAVLHDARGGHDEASPVARSVLHGHLEARRRALELLSLAPQALNQPAAALNLLRRRCERWSDVLLGYLLPHGDVTEFAFDAERVRDFSESLERQRRAGDPRCWHLTLAALRAAFRGALAGPSPNADLNARIGSSVLACFPSELFDATGVLQSLWVTRIEQGSLDAQGMIDDLIDLESDSPAVSHRRF